MKTTEIGTLHALRTAKLARQSGWSALAIAYMMSFVLALQGCQRAPKSIASTSEGKHFIAQVNSLDSLSVVYVVDGHSREYQLGPDDRNKLVTWLEKAVWDESPKKYVVCGRIKGNSFQDLHLLTISSIEHGMRIDGVGYLRGLSAGELTSLLEESEKKKTTDEN